MANNYPEQTAVLGTHIHLDNEQESGRSGTDIAALLRKNPGMSASHAEALAPIVDKRDENAAAQLVRAGYTIDGFNPETGEFDWPLR